MNELSAMDIKYSTEMGGKEALSALGYSRVRSEKYELERWQEEPMNSWEETYVCFHESGACRLAYDTDDGTEGPCYMSVPLMQACIKRLSELTGGDAE